MNWMELVCENLPEGWEIRIFLREGEASIDLINPEGGEFDVCDDDLTVEQMLIARINKAREHDVLQPMGDYCEHGIPEGDFCQPCNAAYKEAAENPDNLTT